MGGRGRGNLGREVEAQLEPDGADAREGSAVGHGGVKLFDLGGRGLRRLLNAGAAGAEPFHGLGPRQPSANPAELARKTPPLSANQP